MTIKNADGNIYLTERAAADADIAGDGQIWVETATPNILKFTDDIGNDSTINTAVMQGNVLALHEGLVCKYVTTATVDIDADAVMLRTTGGAAVKVDSVNLTVDISTGTGVNTLDTGAEASSTWYYLWVIYNGTTVAGLLSVSSTAPTMPSGYTYKGLVGAVYNDSGSDFEPIHQKGNKFTIEPHIDVNAGTATTYTSVSLSVPPIATSASGYMASTDGSTVAKVFLAIDASGVGENLVSLFVSGASVTPTGRFNLLLITAQTAYYKMQSDDTSATVTTTGGTY